MAWKVKAGAKVTHDGVDYVGGDVIPCTDEQAKAMPHAVEAVQDEVKPAPAHVTMVPEKPHTSAEDTKKRK